MLVAGASDELADALLSSLKRDAFVMEAGAYEDPALAEPEEFQEMYPAVHRQLQSLYGTQVFSVLVVDAQIKHGASAPIREMVLGYQGGKTDEGSDQFCHVVAVDGLPLLTSVLQSPEAIVKYSSPAFPLKAALADWEAAMGPCVMDVAPYIVRPIFTSPPSRRLLEVLELRKSHPKAFEFLHTEPFSASDAPIEPRHWSDAYFAAALFVFTPKVVRRPLLSWLEAIHISFQLAWGFPLLATQRQIASEMEDQNKKLTRVRDLARLVSKKLQTVVQDETNKLLRELDRGQFLDNEELRGLFDRAGRWLYAGDGYEVRTMHGADQNDRSKTRRFLGFALHRVLGAPLQPNMTEDDLVASALRAIKSQADAWPTFQDLLTRLLNDATEGFEVLKELCLTVHRSGEELSFYSLAVRFVMSQRGVTPLLVTIKSDEGNTWPMTLQSLAKYDLDGDLTYASPKFPRTRNAPKTWALPLVRLVEVLQIRSSTDHVFLSEILLEDRPAAPVRASFTLDVQAHDRPRKHTHIDGLRTAYFSASVVDDDGSDFRSTAAALKTALQEFAGTIELDWPKGDSVFSISFSR